MDLRKAVIDQLDKSIADGVIEKQIQKTVEETLKSIIEDSFRSYSDFGKTLKEAVKAQLDLSLENLKIPNYNQAVCNIIEKEVDNVIMKEALDPIKEQIKSIAGVLEKQEWKLSEIVEKFKEEQNLEGGSYGEITCIVEKSTYGFYYIYFDKEEEKEPRDCEFMIRLMEHNKVIETIGYEQKGKRVNPLVDNYHNDTMNFFFKLWASRCLIILDERNIDRQYGSHD